MPRKLLFSAIIGTADVPGYYLLHFSRGNDTFKVSEELPLDESEGVTHLEGKDGSRGEESETTVSKGLKG